MSLRVVGDRPRIPFTPFLEIRASPTPWLVKYVLPEKGVAFLAGAPKAGKSFLAIDIALRCASGLPVFGRRTRPCGTVYVAAEDEDGCNARVAAWRKKFGREDNWTAFHLGNGEGDKGGECNLLDRRYVDTLVESLLDSAEAFAENQIPLGLVVFDTLNAVSPGVDEDKSPGQGRVLQALKYISRRTGALVLVLAHFGKSGEERGIRGWSGMDAASDATLHLERSAEDPTLRTIGFSKVKNAPDGEQLSFRLASVGLGIHDEDRDELTSCICVFESAPALRPKSKLKPLNTSEKLTLDAIRYCHDNGPSGPMPAALGALHWQRSIKKPDVLARLKQTGFEIDGEKPDAIRVRLSRALQGLQAAHRIRHENGVIWLVGQAVE